MKPIDIIEYLRLEVTASIDSREQGYVDDLFRKATDVLISSSTASVPSKEKILDVVMNSEFYKNIVQRKEANNFTKELKNLVNDLYTLLTERK